MGTTLRRTAYGLVACLALPTVGIAQGPPGTDIYLVSLETKGGRMSFGSPFNITDRNGYDNQPSFLPDGRSILYTSNREGQTDIYRYYIRTRGIRQVTKTAPESEYSATAIPAGNAFAVVRVEADSTQRLWQFSMDGVEARVVLTDIKPVGYFAWGDDHTVGMFVLADSATPSTFRLADTRSGRAPIVAYNVGRSIHKVPGKHAITFTHRVPELWIKELDLDTQSVRPLIALLGNEYYAWTPDGVLLTAEGSKLFRWDPAAGGTWEEVADFGDKGIDGLTRLAVSPEGDWVALVAARPAN
jgi:hypothetical protein